MRFRQLLWIIGGATVLCAGIARGQDQPAAVMGKEGPEGISVPDSPAAQDLLEKAHDKEQQHQWQAAAEVYRQVSDKYPQRVISPRVQGANETKSYQYEGAGLVASDRIAHWPQEGLDVYRSVYGGAAADAFATAGRNVAALERIFFDDFVTDAGRDAGIALMDVHLEAGRFAAAAWVGQRLLQLHPAVEAQRVVILFRTALALKWAGDNAAAKKLAAELRQTHPNDTGLIEGKDTNLADALDAAMNTSVAVATTQPGEADHWENFGGPAGAGGLSSSTARLGASITDIELVKPKRVAPAFANGVQQPPDWQKIEAADKAAGQFAGIFPVVDGQTLYFQDGRHIYAVDADSGHAPAGWLKTYGGESAGVYASPMIGRVSGEQLTVTVTPGAVLAVLDQPDLQGEALGGIYVPVQGGGPRLVCLDRETGKQVWSHSANDLPDSAGPAKYGRFTGSAVMVDPSIAGDSVLVLTRGGKQPEFDECCLVCLSLSSGELKWSTYLGSATSTSLMDMEAGPERARARTSQLAMAQGRALVLTNLGTVAGVDPCDGRLLWLTTYLRTAFDSPEMARMFFGNRMNNGLPSQAGQRKPWEANPIFTANGRMFVLPSDCRQLLVYDITTGAPVQQLSMLDYGSANMLLGVRDNAVVLTTDKGCYCVDWSTGKVIWPRPDLAADTLSGTENTVFGRGFITSDSIFIPTRHRLYQLSWAKQGKVVSMYPPMGGWAGGEEPGNVLVTAQNVVVAGSSRVDVYTDLQLVAQRFERLMSQDPADAQLRLQYAGALFNAGQNEAGLTRLDEAINLLGGQSAIQPGPAREMIFTKSLDFARHVTGPTATVADGLFDRAAAAATSPLEQAQYRLARAQNDRERKNFVAAVRLSQEILADDGMRAAAVTESQTGADAAEAEITLDATEDPAAYTDVEQAASEALAAAKSAGDPAKLLAVARQFPNSHAAGHAREAAVELYESAGQSQAAVETIRQMYAIGSAIDQDPAQSALLLESLARNELALPNGVGPAIDRLSRAVRYGTSPKLTRPLRLPGGQVINGGTLADAVAQLREVQSREDTAGLPDFHIVQPVSGGDSAFKSSILAQNVWMLVPSAAGQGQKDRAVIWSPGKISVYAGVRPAVLWTVADPGESPVGCAWRGGDLLIWTNKQLSLIGEGGKAVWNSELRSSTDVPVATAGEIVNDAPQASADENLAANQVVNQVVIQQRGQRMIVNQMGGRLIINGAMPVNGIVQAGAAARGAEEIQTVKLAGERIIVATTTGRVIGLNWMDGRTAWQIRLDENPLQTLLSNEHFTVARMEAEDGAQLVVLESATGRVVGRRKYGPPNTAAQLVNVALSEDGTLVLSHFNRLYIKDLYEPWKTPAKELNEKADTDTAPFVGLGAPEQLMVKDGRVAALYDSGKFVRVIDLIAPPAQQRDPLSTGADSAAVTLRLCGPRLFITHSHSYSQYNLDDPADHYSPIPYDLDYAANIRSLFLGKDYAVLLNDPMAARGPAGVNNPDGASPFAMLLGYRRAAVSSTVSKESGKLDYAQNISDTSGIMAWQPVDGGLMYLTADRRLHLLSGARP